MMQRRSFVAESSRAPGLRGALALREFIISDRLEHSPFVLPRQCDDWNLQMAKLVDRLDRAYEILYI